MMKTSTAIDIGHNGGRSGQMVAPPVHIGRLVGEVSIIGSLQYIYTRIIDYSSYICDNQRPQQIDTLPYIDRFIWVPNDPL